MKDLRKLVISEDLMLPLRKSRLSMEFTERHVGPYSFSLQSIEPQDL